MKKYLILLFVWLISVFAFPQNPNLGTSGAQFLKIPIGAKQTAMGGAVAGLTNDVSSVFWNPAGLAQIKSYEAHFSYMKWFDMFDVNAAAIAFNADGIGVFTASALVLSMDKMEITTETSPNGTGRFFDAQDMALALSFARFLTDRFSVGLSVKYVYQRIWNETAEGVAFDIGTQYRLDFRNLTIAMSMTNFGPEMRFEGPDLDIVHDKDTRFPMSRLTPARLQTDAYPLPLHFQVGVGIDLLTADFIKIRGGIDVTHPNDNDERVLLGTEISFFDRLFIRGGYRFFYDDEDITFGAGANIIFGNTIINFDYAYALYDILPNVHRISLSISF